METDYQKNNGFSDDEKIDQNRAIYDNMLVEIVSEENYANYKKRVFIVHDLNSDDTISEQAPDSPLNTKSFSKPEQSDTITLTDSNDSIPKQTSLDLNNSAETTNARNTEWLGIRGQFLQNCHEND